MNTQVSFSQYGNETKQQNTDGPTIKPPDVITSSDIQLRSGITSWFASKYEQMKKRHFINNVQISFSRQTDRN